MLSNEKIMKKMFDLLADQNISRDQAINVTTELLFSLCGTSSNPSGYFASVIDSMGKAKLLSDGLRSPSSSH